MPLDTAASIFVAVLSNATAKPIAWPVIGAVAGVVLFLQGFRMLQYKRLILNTPFSKIRSASMGLVEISGAARGPQTIPAGITGEACYYYRAAAYQLRQSGRNRSWQRVADECLSIPFFVEDPTGRMLVDPRGAQLDLPPNFKDEFDTSFFSDNRDMLPENVVKFLNRNSITFSASTRVEEFCIKPDSSLFVFGTLGRNSGAVQWIPTPHVSPLTSPLHMSLNFFGGSAHGILPSLSVTPPLAAGSSSIARAASPNPAPAPAVAAWSSISMDDENMASANPRGAAHAASTQDTSAVATAEPDDSPADDTPTNLPAVADAPESAGFDLCPPVAVSKGSGGEPARRGGPFMISAHSQREVVQSLAWKSTLCIWGGPVLTLTCFYLLAVILGWT
ncbi:MAG: GIDE domain-containing protein [Candidatus Acidiferrales bacterium]